jgi:hypothetical protein
MKIGKTKTWNYAPASDMLLDVKDSTIVIRNKTARRKLNRVTDRIFANQPNYLRIH